MSVRTLFAAALTYAVLALAQISFAIDSDQVIDPNRSAESGEESGSGVGGILTGDSATSGALITLVGYSVVIAAVAVVVWFFVKNGIGRRSFSKNAGKLKIAETRMLGNRQFLSVVEYGDQKILIGVGPGKIDYLTTLQNGGTEFPEVDNPGFVSEEGGRG